jgi:hypothetical protein
MPWASIRHSSIAAVLFCMVFGLTLAFAQTGTTSLRGTVLDKSGAAIVGAKVVLTNEAQGSSREATTDNSGAYEFPALPPGSYSMTIERSGFRKFEHKNIELLVNVPGTENATLEVGSASETVEVSAQAAIINTTDASLGTAFNEGQIKQLPMEGRNVPDLLSLQAGVAYTGNRPDINKDTDTRSGAVNGARSDQSNITLDGVDVNSDTKGYAFTSVLPITADSVQEFRVTTSNYNADEGRSSGAQVALVTKSGTNNFHGSLYEYHRNTVTTANDYFVKLAQIQTCQANDIPLSEGQCNKAPTLIRNIFGGSLGGPILKDRFFFFLNYEGSRQVQQQSVVRIVPSDAMRDGVIIYPCAVVTDCPGGVVNGVSGQHSVQPGYFGLTPTQIQGMDPQAGVGISSNVMIPYLSTFPHANDNSVGDGLNYQGYRFPGPASINNNWYIARIDFNITKNANQSLFWRGGLRNDTNNGVPYLPNQAPETTTLNFSKGFSLGYSAVIHSNLVNNFRWGFTRESIGNVGNQNTQYVYFRGLNDNSTPNNSSLAVTDTNSYQVPVQNFTDDVSWVKGKHTLQFGMNINILRNPNSTIANSFSYATTNASWLDTAALANTGVVGHFDPYCSTSGNPANGCYDPSANPNEPHYPQVDPSFGNNYDYPMASLLGMITQVNAVYNITSKGTTLAQGAPVNRRFAADSYEFYGQDSWKVTPTVTLNFGLRYSLFSPPWETNGQQVVSNQNLTTWFNNRGIGMSQGVPANQAPPISFDLGGPANNAPGFYKWDTKDFAPRLAVAWAPSGNSGLWKALVGQGGQTTIRAGVGIVYDRIGPSLLATFDANGSFGLSSNLTNGGGIQTPATAPRITGLTGIESIPTQDLTGGQMYAPEPPTTFPQTFPSGNATGAYAVYWGMDSNLKTPYSYTADFSVGRELGHNYSFEVSYVGRFSHRLLSQEDVAAPLDLVDPKTHIDYYTAVGALAKVYRQGVATDNVTAATIGPTSQYWVDMLQAPTHGAYDISRCTSGGKAGATMSPVVAAYDLFCGFSFNETTAVQGLDQGFGLTYGGGTGSYYATGGPYSFVDPQFAALYAWRSIGAAAYNGLQISVNKHMSKGYQFQVNYTYSKSIDISSDANRINDEGGLGGQVINPWNPKALRAVSDFDLRHQINANWIIQLPFGKGQWIGRDVNGVVNAFIGGWQLTGLARWTSGFPIGVGNGAQWPTNWELSGYATQIAPVKTVGASKNGDGSVNIFGSPTAAAAALNSYAATLPGDVGARNTLRGDGFAGLDVGLTKNWTMPWKESQILQFRWEVFNALNLTRFDVQSINLSITNATNFGNYSGLLTNPRVMQFALRYEF